MRYLGPNKEPRSQVNKFTMEVPNAAVLGARRGVRRVFIRADLGSRAVGVIRDGAPYEQLESTQGQPPGQPGDLALNGRAGTRTRTNTTPYDIKASAVG